MGKWFNKISTHSITWLDTIWADIWIKNSFFKRQMHVKKYRDRSCIYQNRNEQRLNHYFLWKFFEFNTYSSKVSFGQSISETPLLRECEFMPPYFLYCPPHLQMNFQFTKPEKNPMELSLMSMEDAALVNKHLFWQKKFPSKSIKNGFIIFFFKIHNKMNIWHHFIKLGSSENIVQF